MGKEQYELLTAEIPNMLRQAATYPEHLQSTILDNMCAAFISGNGGYATIERKLDEPKLSAETTSGTGDIGAKDWDYRSELIRLSKLVGLDSETRHNPEYAAIVAFVRKFCSPEDFDEVDISTDHVLDAWRAVGRKLPTRTRDPLNDAVKKGLLDKVKGNRGCYSLSPTGENFVRDLLSLNEDN